MPGVEVPEAISVQCCVGHTVHEDSPDRVAETVAKYVVPDHEQVLQISCC